MRRMLVSAALLLAVLSAAEAQDRRWAVVEFSVDYMREEPDYAAENGDQALMGTVVEITGEQGYWRRIVTPEPYTAWVTEMGLVEMSGEEKDAFVAAPKYICISDFTYIYEEPSAGSGHLSDLVAGCLVRSVFDAGGRPLKKGKFLACALPSGKRGWVCSAPTCSLSANGSLQDVSAAKISSPRRDASWACRICGEALP